MIQTMLLMQLSPRYAHHAKQYCSVLATTHVIIPGIQEKCAILYNVYSYRNTRAWDNNPKLCSVLMFTKLYYHHGHLSTC